MKSLIAKRSVVIGGHKTSVSLEDGFWNRLKEIAHGQNVTLSNMVGEINAQRSQRNLSSAIRLFVLDHTQASEFTGGPFGAKKTSDESQHNPF